MNYNEAELCKACKKPVNKAPVIFWKGKDKEGREIHIVARWGVNPQRGLNYKKNQDTYLMHYVNPYKHITTFRSDTLRNNRLNNTALIRRYNIVQGKVTAIGKKYLELADKGYVNEL
tara:strand:- start:1068 stop:1418 length:351 start_codon:yes stop_codon:yes gene_type:complete